MSSSAPHPLHHRFQGLLRHLLLQAFTELPYLATAPLVDDYLTRPPAVTDLPGSLAGACHPMPPGSLLPGLAALETEGLLMRCGNDGGLMPTTRGWCLLKTGQPSFSQASCPTSKAAVAGSAVSQPPSGRMPAASTPGVREQHSSQETPSVPFNATSSPRSGQRCASAAADSNAVSNCATAVPLSAGDQKVTALLNDLRELRRHLAGKHQVPAYCICPNATLMTLATTHPLEKKALESIRGIGPRFMAQYADAFLEVLHRHAVAGNRIPALPSSSVLSGGASSVLAGMPGRAVAASAGGGL